MFDIAIVGAGPAGATAAIFAAKAGKKTLLVDNDRGITRRARVLNHYGIMEITGPDLVDKGREQAKRFGAELIAATVKSVARVGDGFRIETDHGTHEARHVVLATGMATDLAEAIGLAIRPGTEPRVKTIVQVDASGRTSVPGIWAAGIIAGVSMHVMVTAGDGAKVAVNVVSELNGARWVDHDVLPPK
jgi:thioredoxin reductase